MASQMFKILNISYLQFLTSHYINHPPRKLSLIQSTHSPRLIIIHDIYLEAISRGRGSEAYSTTNDCRKIIEIIHDICDNI